LTREFRKAWEPNTASKLQEKKYNRLKDFKAVAGQLGITHFAYFSQNANCVTQMRLFRFPRGPTLTFRLVGYSLGEDIARMNNGLRGKCSNLEFSLPPLAVFSNFSAEFGQQVQLTKTFIQGMFPPFSPETAKLNQCKRICLFHYDQERDLVCFRHYSISIKVAGITKGLKRLLVNGEIPDLHDLNDISEFLALPEESEQQQPTAEQEEDSEQTIQEPIKNSQRKIHLIEIGPRLDLELTRIQQHDDSQEDEQDLTQPEEQESEKPKQKRRPASKSIAFPPLYQKTAASKRKAENSLTSDESSLAVANK
jgi:ribosome biogenesis protein SSF1/2